MSEPPFLRVDSVSKSFQDERESLLVLSDINFTLDRGKLCLLCGPSGAGKTTLLNIIAGYDEPDKGEVYFGEERINSLNDDQRARLRTKDIGVVFQSANLVSHLTVLENVLVPTLFLQKSDRCEDIAIQLLKQLHLEDKMKKLPSKLSGGEKRMVSIARALVTKPRLLLADEPTINLDRDNRDNVMRLVKEFSSGGGTTIVATHDEEVAQSSDIILKIRFGKIAM